MALITIILIKHEGGMLTLDLQFEIAPWDYRSLGK